MYFKQEELTLVPDELAFHSRAHRVGSFEGLLFPNVAHRFKPVLIWLVFAVGSPLVQLIGSLRDLCFQIRRWLSLGFAFNLGRGVRLGSRVNLGFGCECMLGPGLRCDAGFGAIQDPISQQFHAVIHEEPHGNGRDREDEGE